MRQPSKPRVARLVPILGGVFLAVLGVRSAEAQWVRQVVALAPGWNAVHLDVQPAARTPDELFAGLPVESVWAWNRTFATVQFVQDPSTLVPEQPDWLTWFPPGSPARDATNLFAVPGGQAYLVKVAGNRSVEWDVVGRPLAPRIDWLPDSFNLVGFAVDPAAPPTFDAFFAGSPAHAGEARFRLGAQGEWQEVTSPSARLRAGEAYWMYCRGASAFCGPVALTFEAAAAVDFGRIMAERSLTLASAGTGALALTLRVLPSVAPSDPAQPALAGAVPLSFFDSSAAVGERTWEPFPETLALSIAPGESTEVQLEVRRRDMPAAPPGRFQSVLEIAGGGARILVPVAAERASGNGGPLSHPREGLWVGNVSVRAVSQPTSATAPNDPVPTARDFQFRLLLHVDAGGQARLLDQVTLMFKAGTLRPDPENPGFEIVDQPGRYVLVTDDALLGSFSGAALRDGQAVGRRVSTAAYALAGPEAMSGAFGDALDVSLLLDYRDPRNPFVHRFHPDHDNKDARFESELAEGSESFTIRRELELEFTAEDPEGLEIAGFGDLSMGGIYRETIRGVHRSALHVEGIFRLRRVSSVGVLNDGL